MTRSAAERLREAARDVRRDGAARPGGPPSLKSSHPELRDDAHGPTGSSERPDRHPDPAAGSSAPAVDHPALSERGSSTARTAARRTAPAPDGDTDRDDGQQPAQSSTTPAFAPRTAPDSESETDRDDRQQPTRSSAQADLALARFARRQHGV